MQQCLKAKEKGKRVTGQIHHHSGRGNKKANILTELKNPKYVSHVVGCSPTDLLCANDILKKIDAHLTVR